MPPWIRQKLHGDNHTYYALTADAVRSNALHTVCEEARCPNRGECWSRGTATFMLLGDVCTRACGFCAVKTGRPGGYDRDEPRRIADAVMGMGLDYVVLTSVNRDDLPDGGAQVFADTLRELRRRKPGIGLELLTPDFQQCQDTAIDTILSTVSLPCMDAPMPRAVAPGIVPSATLVLPCTSQDARRAGGPSAASAWTRMSSQERQLVWGHNVETVPRLYHTVRKGSKYQRSLQLLEKIARHGCANAAGGGMPGAGSIETKSSLMLGLGESRAEVLDVLRDLRAAGVQRVSLGQYLRPTRQHLPVQEYITPEAFNSYEQDARNLGFSWVKAGALVRSSYHAEERQNPAVSIPGAYPG
jgi:lipoic acid synthetase